MTSKTTNKYAPEVRERAAAVPIIGHGRKYDKATGYRRNSIGFAPQPSPDLGGAPLSPTCFSLSMNPHHPFPR